MPRRKNWPENEAGFSDGLNGVSKGGKSQRSGEAGAGSLRNVSAACQRFRENPEFAAAVAKIAASEIAADALRSVDAMDAEWSTITSHLGSISSEYSLIMSCSLRAYTRQSMRRRSSPGRYSRYSENSSALPVRRPTRRPSMPDTCAGAVNSTPPVAARARSTASLKYGMAAAGGVMTPPPYPAPVPPGEPRSCMSKQGFSGSRRR